MIFTIICFCKNYDFHVSVYYSPHTDDEIMIDTSFDSASSYEEIEGLIEKIERKKVGWKAEDVSK